MAKNKNITNQSIFGEYKNAEDRVTSALLQILHYGGHELVAYVFDDCDLPSNNVDICPQVSGDGSRPDGSISCNCNYQIYIESKILRNQMHSTHGQKQFQNHLKLLDDPSALLVYITPDLQIPEQLKNHNRVVWMNWKSIMNKLSDYKTEDKLVNFRMNKFILLVKHIVRGEKRDDRGKCDDILLEAESIDDNQRVIIVGGRWGEDVAIKFGFYACQQYRFFRTAKYLAFYFQNRIKYMFEIEGQPIESTDLRKVPFIDSSYFDEKEPNYNGSPAKVFKLKNMHEFEPTITNDSVDKNGNSCAFVQRQQYTKYDKIINAKTTSDLKL